MSQTSIPRCPFEHIQNPDLEAEQIAETADLTVKLLDKRYPLKEEQLKFLSEHYPSSIRTLRGVHPKSHGCVKATFTINADIAPEFQVGLFAEAGKQFDAIIRFSNAAALVSPDSAVNSKTNEIEHGSRGMAIKVLNVGGEVLTDDNGAHNQDFLMINQPVFAFANTKDYLRLDRVLDQQDDKPDGFFAPLQLNPAVNSNLTEEKKRQILAYMEAENIAEADIQRMLHSAGIIKGIKSTNVGNPLGIQYFSAAPFLFGSDRVMKFSAQPCAVVPPEHSPSPLSDNYLRDALIETMSKDDALEFDFMVQIRHEGDNFGVDNEDIENASSEWKDEFHKVAKITIPRPQPEVDTTEHLAHCEKLAFTPWHSLVEHQPIGSINRLRKSVYQASAEHRLEVDAHEQLPSVVRLLEKLFKSLFG